MTDDHSQSLSAGSVLKYFTVKGMQHIPLMISAVACEICIPNSPHILEKTMMMGRKNKPLLKLESMEASSDLPVLWNIILLQTLKGIKSSDIH